jgi:hypothetical protein
MQSNEQSNLSLYIPHVFPNFTSEYISNIFESINIGKIKCIDLVAKLDRNGRSYNSAYIHFDYWYSGPVAQNFRERVLDTQKEARIIHNDPWYWIVMENTAKKHISGERKIRINLSENNELENYSESVGLISELYNEKMDIQCEFNEKLQSEDLLEKLEKEKLEKLEKENKILKNTNQIHLNHIKKIYRWIQSMEFLDKNILEEHEEKNKNNCYEQISFTKKIFNQLISSNTLEEAIEQVWETLYKMTYKDNINYESIEENPNNYSLCSDCLIWYEQDKTICDCSKCVQFE